MKILSRITPTQFLYLWAILASVALSVWLNNHSIINNDGISYLRATQAFLDNGFWAAKDIYRWPFYPILIAYTHMLTQLSLEHAAFLLNTVLCAFIVTGFITVVKALGGQYRTQVCAAIIILFHTGFNEYRDYIIRDFGHWACMLYGLYFLILYAQNRQLRYGLAFGITMIVAFLFRTEAIIVMLIAPMALLLPITGYKPVQRLWHALGAYILLLPILIVVLLNPDLILANPWFKRLGQADFIQRFSNVINEFRTVLSSHISDNELVYVVVGGFVVYSLARLLLLLSPLYAFLTGYALYTTQIKPSVARTMLVTFIVSYSAVVLGFLFFRFFLSGRYIMPVVLLLSLWAPFGLSAIYHAWKTRARGFAGRRWLFPLVALGLIYMLGDSLISSAPSKQYLKQAGYWLAQNTPANSIVYSNTPEVGYYSHRINNPREIKPITILKNQEWQAYDYLAIKLDSKDTELHADLAKLPIKPVMVFDNKEGNSVQIYKNAQSRSRTGTGD
jgi:hypothetical protein